MSSIARKFWKSVKLDNKSVRIVPESSDPACNTKPVQVQSGSYNDLYVRTAWPNIFFHNLDSNELNETTFCGEYVYQ